MVIRSQRQCCRIDGQCTADIADVVIRIDGAADVDRIAAGRRIRRHRREHRLGGERRRGVAIDQTCRRIGQRRLRSAIGLRLVIRSQRQCCRIDGEHAVVKGNRVIGIVRTTDRDRIRAGPGIRRHCAQRRLRAQRRRGVAVHQTRRGVGQLRLCAAIGLRFVVPGQYQRRRIDGQHAVDIGDRVVGIGRTADRDRIIPGVGIRRHCRERRLCAQRRRGVTVDQAIRGVGQLRLRSTISLRFVVGDERQRCRLDGQHAVIIGDRVIGIVRAADRNRISSGIGSHRHCGQHRLGGERRRGVAIDQTARGIGQRRLHATIDLRLVIGSQRQPCRIYHQGSCVGRRLNKDIVAVICRQPGAVDRITAGITRRSCRAAERGSSRGGSRQCFAVDEPRD